MYHYPDHSPAGNVRGSPSSARLPTSRRHLRDEPTGSLDRKNAANVEGILWELKKRYKMTLVIATHSHDISKKCDKLIDMG
jgi:putative ABC transport system ATP-binding protein